VWRGKRLPVDDFLGSPERRIGFCDGMIVVDVNCDIIQTVSFSNFETGYPDMYVQPDMTTLRLVGWAAGEAFVLGTLQSHHGSPLAVAPRNVLDVVLARLADRGVTMTARTVLAGRMMRAPGEPCELLPGGLGKHEEAPGAIRVAADGLLASGVPVRFVDAASDGTFRVGLGPQALVQAGDAAVITKAALKETALQHDANAVFMTKVPGSAVTSELEVTLELTSGTTPDNGRLATALDDVRGLLQPSITAFKAGPAMPGPVASDQRIDVRAASEADPFTALAAFAAATGAALDAKTELNDSGSPESLALAASRLEAAPWVADWLGEPFVENTVALFRHEVSLFDAAVTDWESTRYWTQS
jgi:glutamine synthetase